MYDFFVEFSFFIYFPSVFLSLESSTFSCSHVKNHIKVAQNPRL